MLELLRDQTALAIASAFVFGLLTGSFLNVVILRLPPWLEWRWKRDSREMLELPPSAEASPPGIVVERSHCPRCGHQLSGLENIPLVSFLALRGRCRGCGTRISWQYPAVELLTGIAFAVVVWQFGVTWEALAALVFTGFLIGMSGIDLRTTLLPDGMTLPLMWLGLLLSVLGVLAPPPAVAIVGAIVGYLALWSVYWAFKLLTGKEGMGYGDFKLLAAIGAWCGWEAILPVLLLSSLIGAIVGGTWLAIRGRDRATPIPFGPFLAGAGWLQLVFQMDLLGAYMRFSGLSG